MFEIVRNIVFGLAALGVVVFVHELGHFLAARLVGIKVEAFSIGWGKAIIRKRVGGVEYRIGAFPAGGYCKMAGETSFEEAWKTGQNNLPQPEGSYFGASPWRRIVVAAAGPLFNIIFAAVLFSFIWGLGFEFETMDNRIVLASDSGAEGDFAAVRAGLKTGDRIVAIDGQATGTFHDIQKLVAVSAEKPLIFTVERGSERLNVEVTPGLQKDSGAGIIGVYPFTEPVIGAVSSGSAAEEAGLEAGDRIVSVNGCSVPNTIAIARAFDGAGELPPRIPVEIERSGRLIETEISVPEDEGENLGIQWKTFIYHTPRYTPAGAVKKGAGEAMWTLVSTIRGFRLLFRGVDLTKSVAGPIRITWMAGEAASEGFGERGWAGLRLLANFLAVISIALGVTNLLPLPVLDGGAIVLFLIEMAMRRPLHPRVFSVVQTAGVIIIAGLMIVALTGDVMFLIRR
ncbi:MAG: RIP metalloprotease RseP [Spirochaetaceae bacterium]|jgi:regulator of sigma E protease|nr:RIP metalloprotease RseP [Spirochaetaceae bacterium]